MDLLSRFPKWIYNCKRIYSIMNKLAKRLLVMACGFIIMILSFSYIYMQGMQIFEGEQVAYYVAVQKTVESITTAGFGGHAPWDSVQMNVIVIVMNLIGVSLFFFGVPIALAPIIAPRLKDAIRQRPSTKSDKENHILITEYNDTDEVLIEKLSEYGYEYVLVIEDEKRALELERQGHNVVWGSPEDTAVLKNANISDSRAIVVDIGDNINPSVLLSAKRCEEDIDRISVVKSKNVKSHHNLAGSDFVLESRTEFGKALGLRSVLDIVKEIDDITDSTPNIREYVVHPDDEIVGKTVGEYRNYNSQSVLCGWFDGQFVPGPSPDKKITANSILITTTDEKNADSSRNSPSSESQSIVVAGYGSVGKSVEDTVTSRGYNVVTIDKDDKDADINGNITNPEVLKEAGISDAKSIVITINDDTDAIYSTLVVSNISPDTEVITRVNKEDNIWKVYDSGADFVISLETLTGDVVADRIIEDKEFIAPTQELSLVSVSGSEYEGLTIQESNIIDEIGYVIAVERENGELIGNIRGDTEIKSGDTIVVIEN